MSARKEKRVLDYYYFFLPLKKSGLREEGGVNLIST